MAASKEDESLAASINSLITKDTTIPHMSTVVQEVNPAQQVPQVNAQPVIKQEEQKKEETISLTKAEFEQFKKDAEAKKLAEEQVTKLVNKDKTNTLNTIFKSVKDESVKKTLVEKYFSSETDILNDFYNDITAHVFPSLLEEQKAQAESELKNKLAEDNKGQSKAASLPKEPEIPKSEEKIVPNRVNQVKQFDRLMRGFS
jgi:hypothetical protein